MAKDFLTSHKRIYDYVHGFIRFDEFEKHLIDSVPFQRLHYIHQLGISYLIYPGATQMRFEHSLGVMELSTRIYRRICKTVRPDLFHFIPRKGSMEYIYWKKVLRIAALCHDLGHLPFSHVAESDILGEGGHEKFTVNIIKSKYLKDFWDKLQQCSSFNKGMNRDIIDDVIKIAIGEKKLSLIMPDKKIKFSAWEKILSQIITGDFFGADRIDYLLRDAKCTGIVYGLFDYLQLIEMLRILPSASSNKDTLELGIDESGIESCEALLLARHFMHKRVYQHPSIKAYNFHLRRVMRQLYSSKKDLLEIDNYIHMNDAEVIYSLSRAAKDKKNKAYNDARCILYRKEHFKAIPLPHSIKESDLQSFKYNNHIEDDKIEWEFHDIFVKLDLSFPIAKHHLTIHKAKECSSLLSSLPPLVANWLYLSPEYELLFLESLKDV
jgi:uncharacterized protein